MKLTGSQLVAEILLEHGVDTVFGYPGGTALNLYDTLYEYRDKIRHILTAHEQGAAHAADGYSRATGKTGVVFATSGPGATNLVTGIATAFMDSIPMIAITANVPDSLIGRDAFQEICITGVTMPITKHTFFVNKIEDLADAMRNAFRIANSGRKGPVLIDITKDVTAAKIDYKPAKPMPLNPPPVFNKESVQEVAAMINAAERPIVYFGGGVAASKAGPELRQLLETADIPATYTLMAAGILGYDNKRNLGLIGMHGSIAANRAVDRADLIIALGARFSDRVALNPEKFGKKAHKIQVDIDTSEINKNVLVDVGISADIKEFLTALLPLIKKNDHADWVSQSTEWKKKTGDVKSQDAELHPSEIIQSICDMTDKETIYVTDVGQHQMWASSVPQAREDRRLHYKRRSGNHGIRLRRRHRRTDRMSGKESHPLHRRRLLPHEPERSLHGSKSGASDHHRHHEQPRTGHGIPVADFLLRQDVMLLQRRNVKPTSRSWQKHSEQKVSPLPILTEFEEVFKKALQEKGPVWIDCAISRERTSSSDDPGRRNYRRHDHRIGGRINGQAR